MPKIFSINYRQVVIPTQNINSHLSKWIHPSIYLTTKGHQIINVPKKLKLTVTNLYIMSLMLK